MQELHVQVDQSRTSFDWELFLLADERLVPRKDHQSSDAQSASGRNVFPHPSRGKRSGMKCRKESGIGWYKARRPLE